MCLLGYPPDKKPQSKKKQEKRRVQTKEIVMIHMMRNSKGSNIAKLVLFSLLIISFVIWGIGSMNFSSNSNAIITINGKPIDNKNFETLYNQNKSQLEQYIPNAQIPKRYIANMAIKQLVQRALVTNYAKKIGLQATDNQVAEQIKKIPFLFDNAGNFDPQKFNFALQHAGITKEDFFNSIKEDILTQQASGLIGYPITIPKPLEESLFNWEYLNRDIQYISIPLSHIKVKTPSVTLQEQKIYYQNNKKLFEIPEKRNVDILIIPISYVKDNIEITQQDLQDAYTTHKSMFITPEMRTINQIMVKSKKEATKIKEKIQKGTPFLKAAKTMAHMHDDTIKLGSLAQNQIPDKKFADVAFSLNKGEVSEPFKTPFGWTILQVTNITPQHTQSFEEVKKTLEKLVLKQKEGDQLSSITQQINNMAEQGTTLDKIAATLHLKIKSISVSSKDQDALSSFPAPHLMDKIFQSDLNVISPAISLNKVGYLYFSVKHITPQTFTAFKGAQKDIIQALKQQKIQQKIEEKANNYVQEINNSKKTLSSFSSHIRKTSFTLNMLKKGHQKDKLPQPFLQQAISSSRHQAFSYMGPKEVLIGVTTHVSLPSKKTKEENIDTFYSEMNHNRISYITSQYLMALGDNSKVKVNRAALDQFLKNN